MPSRDGRPKWMVGMALLQAGAQPATVERLIGPWAHREVILRLPHSGILPSWAYHRAEGLLRGVKRHKMADNALRLKYQARTNQALERHNRRGKRR